MKARCLRCRREFVRRRAGHVFCSRECRHRGPRRPDDLPAPTEEEIARLFDGRPDEERVAEDDWFPADDGKEVYLVETLGARRRWFLNLVKAGRLYAEASATYRVGMGKRGMVEAERRA